MAEQVPALVGRDGELAAIGQLLEEACAGAPRFAFFTGEPGIGKTSLVARLVAAAEDRGCLVLQGSAAEFESELPFGLVVDAFDEYLASLDPSAFNRLASDDLGELAGVFPALRALDPKSDEPSTAAERFRAHRAVAELIERLARSQPLVLVLDDLHWADGASVELATHLLRRPPRAPLLVAGAFRTGQADRALETAIDRAARGDDGVRRISVGPLAERDTGALLAESRPDERDRLYRASGGNPFYLLQLARMHSPGQRREAVLDGDGGVPEAVTAAIAGELEGLSPAGRGLAEAAAVAGDPFELDLAVASAGMEERDAFDALDELTARDLIRPGEVPRRFRFRHPLVRRAVYESFAPGARLAAHGRTAAALAERGAGAAMLAHHVEHSARHGDAAAVALLKEAGEQAARRAPASAARWFGAAAALQPASSPPGDRVALLMGLAGALAAIGRFEDSRSSLLECIDLTPGDDEAVRVALIGACASVEQLLGHHEEANARLVAALDRLPDRPSPEAAALHLYMATGAFYRQDYDAMRKSSASALTAARALEDEPLIAASTAALTAAWAFQGEIEQALVHHREGAALVDAMPDEELALRLDALANLCAAELYLDLYPEGEEHSRRGLRIAHATGQAEISPFLIPVLGSVLQLTGRLVEAAEVLDDAVEAARLSGNVQALAWNLLNQANAALSVGALEQARELAAESVDITSHLDRSLVSSYSGANQSFVLCEAGEFEAAIRAVHGSAGGEELPLIPGGWRANYFELVARASVGLGHLEEAERAARRAAGVAERVGTPLSRCMAHRAAAAVELARDDGPAAAASALASVAAADEIGAVVEGALARMLAGRALAAAGDSDGAVEQLERAASDLGALGAPRYREQAERELRKLGRRIHHRTAPGRKDGGAVATLTEREAGIARLVTDRLTNLEIASELFLSVKTIETHMRNIFRKLDVSSRVEVARVMERERG